MYSSRITLSFKADGNTICVTNTVCEYEGTLSLVFSAEETELIKDFQTATVCIFPLSERELFLILKKKKKCKKPEKKLPSRVS